MATHLILGGARSGKSAHALAVAEKLSRQRTIIVTAEAGDEEMAARIARHRKDRNDSWHTVECPVDVPTAITEHALRERVVLVDCLTLWLSNLMHSQACVSSSIENVINAISNAQGHVLLVSNEVGLGLVPESPLGREFRDAQGRLNQSLARACERVEFVAAGLPLVLKGR